MKCMCRALEYCIQTYFKLSAMKSFTAVLKCINVSPIMFLDHNLPSHTKNNINLHSLLLIV